MRWARKTKRKRIIVSHFKSVRTTQRNDVRRQPNCCCISKYALAWTQTRTLEMWAAIGVVESFVRHLYIIIKFIISFWYCFFSRSLFLFLRQNSFSGASSFYTPLNWFGSVFCIVDSAHAAFTYRYSSVTRSRHQFIISTIQRTVKSARANTKKKNKARRSSNINYFISVPSLLVRFSFVIEMGNKRSFCLSLMNEKAKKWNGETNHNKSQLLTILSFECKRVDAFHLWIQQRRKTTFFVSLFLLLLLFFAVKIVRSTQFTSVAHESNN